MYEKDERFWNLSTLIYICSVKEEKVEIWYKGKDNNILDSQHLLFSKK
jgi:hypothetical protein